MAQKGPSKFLLGDGIEPQQPGETPDQFAERVSNEWRRLNNVLMNHFNIPPDDPRRFQMLALHLAIDSYPAFRVKKSRGVRPNYQNVTTDYVLLAALNEAESKKLKLPLTEIVRRVAKKFAWDASREEIARLRNRLQELKNPNSPAHKRLQAYHLEVVGPMVRHMDSEGWVGSGAEISLL